LTLNIFTNNIGTNGPFRKKSQPVMVWIHGGGFTIGSKDLYRMDELLTEDVVYVAMNYRLAALGFMSFGNDVVSGNMGLKDQQLAIQWVRDNIQHFGGDPNRITIFGESAGALSVQAQVLSPWNDGLLNGAIAQSGSILNLHFQPQGSEMKYAKNIADTLGCPTTLDESTLECLQKVDMEKMLPNVTDADEAQYDPSILIKYFTFPVVDSYATNPFIPLDPLEALKTGMFNRIPYEWNLPLGRSIDHWPITILWCHRCCNYELDRTSSRNTLEYQYWQRKDIQQNCTNVLQSHNW